MSCDGWLHRNGKGRLKKLAGTILVRVGVGESSSIAALHDRLNFDGLIAGRPRFREKLVAAPLQALDQMTTPAAKKNVSVSWQRMMTEKD